MLRTFNCGIGMIVVVDPRKAQAVMKVLRRCGEKVTPIGEITRAAKGKPRVAYTGRLAL